MKQRLLIFSMFGLFLAVVAGVGFYRRSEAQETAAPPVIKPAVVRCELLAEREHLLRESFYGFIEPELRVSLAFQIAGRLEQLGPRDRDGLRENDPVTEGQVLAVIEPRRYEAAYDQAQAMAREASAAEQAANAEVSRAQAAYEDALSEHEAKIKFQAQGVSNPREVERAETAMKLAAAQLEAAKARLEAASAVYQSRDATAAMARVNLEDDTLRSPMDGVVAEVPVELGEMVSPGQPVVGLVSIDRVKLVIGVVERRLPLLQEGQKVEVEVLALSSAARLGDAQALAEGTLREGLVTLVPPAADSQTGLFNVEIDLPNEDHRLRPGMVAKAAVIVKRAKALAVPAEAVVREGDQVTAFFVDENYQVGLDMGLLGEAAVDVPTPVARKVRLEPAAYDRDHYLLTDLPAGLHRLIVEGQARLVDGQPVVIVDEDPPAAEAEARLSTAR